MPRRPSKTERTSGRPSAAPNPTAAEPTEIEDALNSDIIQNRIDELCEQDANLIAGKVECVLVALTKADEPMTLSTIKSDIGFSISTLEDIVLQLNYFNITTVDQMGDKKFYSLHPSGLGAVRRAYEKHRTRLAAINDL